MPSDYFCFQSVWISPMSAEDLALQAEAALIRRASRSSERSSDTRGERWAANQLGVSATCQIQEVLGKSLSASGAFFVLPLVCQQLRGGALCVHVLCPTHWSPDLGWGLWLHHNKNKLAQGRGCDFPLPCHNHIFLHGQHNSHSVNGTSLPPRSPFLAINPCAVKIIAAISAAGSAGTCHIPGDAWRWRMQMGVGRCV